MFGIRPGDSGKNREPVDILIRLLHELKIAVFPSKCTVCDEFFLPEKRTGQAFPDYWKAGVDISAVFAELMSRFLCQKCRHGLVPITSPLCTRCGSMFKSREGGDHLCAACIEETSGIRKARAPGVYCGTLMETIHAFKYKKKIQLARPLGDFLFLFYWFNWEGDEPDLILPVPLHARRMRKRGFNQAYLMIRHWPELFKENGLSDHGFRVGREALIRTRETRPQVGLGRKERRKNMRNAFRIPEPSSVSGKRVLLVDDVYTTGSTVEECTRLLLKSGADRADVITLARV